MYLIYVKIMSNCICIIPVRSGSVRIKNNVLAQPAFKSRGSGYVRFNAVTITGNGFIDKYQTGGEVVVDDLTLLPSPGDNMRFAGITDVIYKVGSATVISGSAPSLPISCTLFKLPDIIT